MEATMINSVSRSSNLLAILMDNNEVRNAVAELVQTWEDIQEEDSRGNQLARMLDPEGNNPSFSRKSGSRWCLLSEPEYQPFQSLLADLISRKYHDDQTTRQPGAYFLDQISIQGVRYATDTSLLRDSHIIFMSGTSGHQEPGQIRSIFQHTHTKQAVEVVNVYLAVAPYSPYLGTSDPYRRYSLGGFLCEKDMLEVLLIEASQVISHFAPTPLMDKDREIIHVRPLNKVCL